MYAQRPPRGFGGGFGGGLTGQVPRDVWTLLAIVLVSFSLQFFAATAALPAALRLTPNVWRLGFVWQVVTYPFIGTGAPGFWFLLELLILLMFGRDVYYRLGRRRFWGLLLRGALVGAATAIVVQLLMVAVSGAPPGLRSLGLMQGQHMLLVILIAAFATLYGDATIYLFFVLPIQARWFLGLEILFAFLGFLASHDLAGFLGICAVVGYVYLWLVAGRSGGGLREIYLRLQAWWIRARLAWLRKRRGFTVVRGDKDRDGGPWVH